MAETLNPNPKGTNPPQSEKGTKGAWDLDGTVNYISEANETKYRLRQLELLLKQATTENETLSRDLKFKEKEQARVLGEFEKSKDELRQLQKFQEELQTQFMESKKSLQETLGQLGTLKWKLKVYEARGMDAKNAPMGTVTLVFSDIMSSSEMWEANAEQAYQALIIHNGQIQRCQGYEVKTEGDAFMVAFSNTINACQFCLLVQEKLLEGNWPSFVYAYPWGKTETSSSGLRIRMGMHTGVPTCKKDDVTHRMDYFGPVVNRAARVCSAAQGGQILLSEAAFRDVTNPNVRQKLGNPKFASMGRVTLKGLEGDENIFEMLPLSLEERVFPPPNSVVESNNYFNLFIFVDNMVKGLKEQVEKLKNEKSVLLEHMQHLEQKIVVADEKTKNLLKRLTEIKFRKGDEAALEFEKLTDDIHEITKDQQEFRKLLKNAETRNLSMTSQIADLETKVQTLSQEKAEREAALDKDNQSLRDTIKNLSRVLEDVQKKVDEKPRILKKDPFFQPPLLNYDTPRSPSTSSQAPQSPVETPKSPESDNTIERLIDEVLANAKVFVKVEKLPFGYYQIGDKKIRIMVLGVNRLAVKENNGNWTQLEKWVQSTFINRQTTSHVIQLDFLDPKGVRSLSPLANGKPVSPTEKSKRVPFPK